VLLSDPNPNPTPDLNLPLNLPRHLTDVKGKASVHKLLRLVVKWWMNCYRSNETLIDDQAPTNCCLEHLVQCICLFLSSELSSEQMQDLNLCHF